MDWIKRTGYKEVSEPIDIWDTSEVKDYPVSFEDFEGFADMIFGLENNQSDQS